LQCIAAQTSSVFERSVAGDKKVREKDAYRCALRGLGFAGTVLLLAGGGGKGDFLVLDVW